MSFFKGFDNKETTNIQIQTTSICAGKCIMCPYMDSWHRQHPGVMNEAIFDRILDQISDLNVQVICPYLENEPLADNKIFERISKIRRAFPNAVIAVSTNALSLSDDNIKRFLNCVCDGPNDIWISFHGVDKRTYEGIMGLPFEKCLSNILHLLMEATDDINIRIHGAGEGRRPELNHDYRFNREAYIAFWRNICNINNIKNGQKSFFYIS